MPYLVDVMARHDGFTQSHGQVQEATVALNGRSRTLQRPPLAVVGRHEFEHDGTQVERPKFFLQLSGIFDDCLHAVLSVVVKNVGDIAHEWRP